MFLFTNNAEKDNTYRDFIAEWKSWDWISLSSRYSQADEWNIFCSYLLCWESQRRYWYRSLWGQFLRAVLKYLEAIIYCLIISMQRKTSRSFSIQMPFTAHPPHHQIQGTRNNICRWVGWRAEGMIHTVDLLLCGFHIVYSWEVSGWLPFFEGTSRWREVSWNRDSSKGEVSMTWLELEVQPQKCEEDWGWSQGTW